MNKSPVFLKTFKNTVERILHVPGNYTGQILEMAVVIDGSLSREQVADYLPELLGTLKIHSEVFRNVRLNVVQWQGDENITCKVSPMSMVQLSSYYEDYQQQLCKKSFEKLISYLRLFQARAKLIILLTDGKYQVEQEELLQRAMQPFLEKKLMQVVLTGDGADIRYRTERVV
ncbi:MAG: hypothetical protein J5986_15195 [Roseburia sp.]|nr:hypothetical protein [Roseburia sp.]